MPESAALDKPTQRALQTVIKVALHVCLSDKPGMRMPKGFKEKIEVTKKFLKENGVSFGERLSFIEILDGLAKIQKGRRIEIFTRSQWTSYTKSSRRLQETRATIRKLARYHIKPVGHNKIATVEKLRNAMHLSWASDRDLNILTKYRDQLIKRKPQRPKRPFR